MHTVIRIWDPFHLAAKIENWFCSLTVEFKTGLRSTGRSFLILESGLRCDPTPFFRSLNCERVRLCKIMSNDDFFLELLCCSNDPICGILPLPCHIVSLSHSVNSIFEIAQTPSPLLIPVSWSHFVASKMLEGHLGKLSKIIFWSTYLNPPSLWNLSPLTTENRPRGWNLTQPKKDRWRNSH